MDIINIVLSLIALIILEIVLGIDNLVILSILTEKLPQEKRKKARRLGLTFAWVTRLLLLGSAVYMVKLIKPIVTIGSLSFSFRDIFLLLGGTFLIWKSTDEIHQDIMNEPSVTPIGHKKGSSITFSKVVTQIALLDIIFSLDSVLTAVGLTSEFWIMAAAITCAILIMIYASEPVSEFISKHPTVKMLALSYLILIGTMLVADGFSFHVPRGYLYFSMGFSLGVESLNLYRSSRKKRKNISRN
ncbi:TerC family protein [Legionella fallonii]|uniref:Integral membrane protein TerC n=1 Tax=Legionella fallonii LLAP-10 TaxID=1212491 RepID=A0A098G4W4_9GAMM|nr:TerC family protein [Legionella fallonii]CEG57006.1 Integral membrane protein TerC [Legionella fallonii LLAP-10]